ncbi:MAG TPA: hypothetical protein VHK88_11475 [Aquihabitans sp.]|nr:hypothetical protein [Aquihabitans sp.]
MSGGWESEDAGPARTQVAEGPAPTGALRVVSRDAPGAHMVIIGAGGDVFVYGTSFGEDHTAWVEKIDPETLERIDRIDGLAGGPWWPGGLALHPSGALHVVHGRWAHRLTTALEITASRALPEERPYNSFVILPDGHLLTKDLVRDGSVCSSLAVLEPDDLRVVDEVEAPEGSIARLSADGDDAYVIGDHTAFRYRWDGAHLVRDPGWSFRYRTDPDQSYGWDPVIAGGQVWFLDNGDHRYDGTMVGRGVAPGPVHLVRVAVDDADDHEVVPVCGSGFGAVTNPPLYDERTGIVVAYDSANGVIAAFDGGGPLTPRWQRALNTAGHLIGFPDDGSLMAYHHEDGGESVVFLDIASGEERSRVATGSPMQSVVFPAAGGGVAYYASFSTIARISGS